MLQKNDRHIGLCVVSVIVLVLNTLGPIASESIAEEADGGDGNKQSPRKDALGLAIPQEKTKGINLRRLEKGLYKLGEVTIDAREKLIRCPGKVNMDRGGPIELLACTEDGKRHETIFVLNVRPFNLQLALLLLDLTRGRNPAKKSPKHREGGDAPKAGLVSIDVRWKDTKKDGPSQWNSRSAGKFLHNVKKDRPMREVKWAFIGSRWENDVFQADRTGSIIVTYRDPLGVLELASKEVNSDTWFEANQDAIPPIDTEVEMIIRVIPDEEKGQGEEKNED